MVNLESKRLEDILRLLIGLTLIVWVNVLSSQFFERIDLTEEKRYTIKEATKEMLSGLDDKVYVEVFLAGKLNSSFTRFQRSIRETLEEFQVYSDNKVQFTFTDPSSALNEKARNEFMQNIMARGIQPTRVFEENDGASQSKLIFPGAVISYGGAEEGVMLLGGNRSATAEEKINQSIEGIEYALASTIYNLASIERKSVGIVKGHDELSELEMSSLLVSLRASYVVRDVSLQNEVENTDALFIAKPTTKFSETEKYHLDQYLMSGGKVFMMLDKLQANMDSASNMANYSFPYDLNLDDQLFKYGVRINNDLIQDFSAASYPVNVSAVGDEPQIKLLKWWFYPILNRFGDHVITKNLFGVLGKFVSTIDTVKADGVKKTPLIYTSDYSRTMTAPVNVSLQDLRKQVTPEMFGKSQLPVAYLLEGQFNSLYKNRFKPKGVNTSEFVEVSSKDAKLIVVSDGDLARNDINPKTGSPQPLGYDPFTQTTYANEDFILNAINYLVDDQGLITARGKEVKIRPLNKVKIKEEKLYWQLLNIVLPIVLVIVYGLLRYILRKRKYTGFKTD
ncbi:gliding motility-associated ABC transporter substrate-binding protein GldG [Fulvivirga lutea]|uniref:Gliding motility-associated ABC transporter substrate-binding protein GldG n=1 Tax=Fulvivirga lutea TaxID=2810512 RepID=A0A975A0R2_9BACT|nr:gliding motility-associated ABC transporter substrate-binding protein GldG [Fulvivirga lutea]QSE97076.1 gliding motility-associated ABC transporter substrate-binding protein GldG [Fulvivirga lutea]